MLYVLAFLADKTEDPDEELMQEIIGIYSTEIEALNKASEIMDKYGEIEKYISDHWYDNVKIIKDSTDKWFKLFKFDEPKQKKFEQKFGDIQPKKDGPDTLSEFGNVLRARE